MSPRTLAVALPVFLSSLGPIPGSAGPLRDGKTFDPGAAMTQPAEGAPPELHRVTAILGTWEVAFQGWEADSLIHQGTGRSRITLMNRGHSIGERLHLPDADGKGNDLDVLEFLAYSPANGIWMLGSADTYTESVVLYSGTFEQESLVLRNAERRLGSTGLVHTRWTLGDLDRDSFTVLREDSHDGGSTWKPSMQKHYRRSAEPFLEASAEPYGAAAPGLPEAAGQFDFLLGEWDTVHDMTLPTGKVKFPVRATATRTLNGHGILEFSWYDVDPRLPDAATSLARIYNRAMRRWECMFLTNRFNSVLRFGGVQEGNRIVLHRFGAHTADNPISYWIFSDIEPDSYRWHAETSRDRGRTFEDTWIIEATRAKGGDPTD